nr:OmpA family protein [uncultured Rhodoferax sp.]
MLKRPLFAACAVLVVGFWAASAQAWAQPAEVPLVAGLTVTTALHEPGQGDYESTKWLESRTADGWRIAYSASFPAMPGKGAARLVQSVRLQSDADLAKASIYRQRFEAGTEEDYPGTTALGASSAVLKSLRANGKTPFRIVEDASLFSARSNDVLALAKLFSDGEAEFRGDLRRVGMDTVPVLVNGRLKTLTAVVAQGELVASGGQRVNAKFHFLDDELNPLALRWEIGTLTLSVVRIDWPVPKAVSEMGAELAKKRRVALPGLYFDFGSSNLRPESAQSLQVILKAIQSTAGNLRLEGHTDNIGSAPANQALSQARAQAVKSALARLDASLAQRLSASGQGAIRPVADNTTLAGRAQNRRVELIVGSVE